MKKEMISVIVPLYNEEDVIAESYKRLSAVMQSMMYDYELIFINDGSSDRTLALALEIHKTDMHVVIIDFARNFGHQLAVTAGLDQACGDAVVIIDADLQDPPELISDMIAMWKNGAEVVYGKRAENKSIGLFKKFTSFAYYRVLNALSGWKIPEDTGDFRLIDRKVADVMRSMPEHNRFLRGMVSWVGFNQQPLEFVRQGRFAGVTKYPLKKMLRLAADGIIAFSGKPFALMRWIGLVMFGVSFFLWVMLLILWIAIEVAMSTAVIVTTCIWVGGLLLLALGICGMYFERMYDELKGRPLYITRKVHKNEGAS